VALSSSISRTRMPVPPSPWLKVGTPQRWPLEKNLGTKKLASFEIRMGEVH
jgi:hypothetical protein